MKICEEQENGREEGNYIAGLHPEDHESMMDESNTRHHSASAELRIYESKEKSNHEFNVSNASPGRQPQLSHHLDESHDAQERKHSAMNVVDTGC